MAQKRSSLKRGLLTAAAVTLFTVPFCGHSGEAHPLTQHDGSNRFLFIVETSSSMQKRTNGVYTVLSDLITSGMKGNLAPGDTIGLWNYNKQLFAGRFPLKEWSPKSARFIFEGMLEYLGAQRWEKSANIQSVQSAMAEVAKSSDDLTVIWISSGEKLINGTPFDAEINKTFTEWKKEEKKRQMPFVTVLVASHGVFVKNTVAPMPWDVLIPRIARRVPTPPRPVANAARPTAVLSEGGASVPASRSVAEQRRLQAPATAPLIMTGNKPPQNESSASAARAETLTTATRPIAGPLLPAIPVQARTISPEATTGVAGAPVGALYFHGPSPVEEKGNGSTLATEAARTADAATAESIQPRSAPPSARLPVVTEKVDQTSLHPAAVNPPAIEVEHAEPQAETHIAKPQAAVVIARPFFVNPFVCAIAAIGVLCAIAGFVFLRRSQSRTSASLITKSIELAASNRKA
jgi:hypothetical protein